MSWSSDIRCLYCDGKLPLFRKITSGQFCSAAHRKSYWQEQERLGVERLHQTHDSLHAFRPAEGIEAILGYSEPPPATVAPVPGESPSLVSTPPKNIEAPAPLAGFQASQTRPQPQWPVDRLAIPDPAPVKSPGPVRIPLRTTAALMRDLPAAGATRILIAPVAYAGKRKVEALHPAMRPFCEVTHHAAPAGSALAPTDDVPRAGKLMTLASFAAHDRADGRSRRDPWPAVPFGKAQKARLPFAMTQPALAAPALAGLRSISMDQVPLVHGTWIDGLRAIHSEGESPRYKLATPALRPRLKLASGSRYPVATRGQAATATATEPANIQPVVRAVEIPRRMAMAAAAGPDAAGPVSYVVRPNEPVPLGTPTEQAPNLPQPLGTQPLRPASHLEPLDAKPSADFLAPSLEDTKSHLGSGLEVIPPEEGATTAAAAWMHIAGFWRHAPRDLKLLVFGIPILLALAFHPSLKKIPYTAPEKAGGIERKIEHGFQNKMSGQWMAVKQTLVDRAAIGLDEDFRAGLDDWTSRGGTTEWTFDATGFVRPGPLALYRPSVDLTDYQMQFLGMIDKKALSWVVRAADFDDYYVVKLVVLKPGPVPTIGVTRYAVIHGVAQNRVDTPAFINAREDMLYRVRMDIHADTFALTVQGQLIDSWAEPRLPKGGVGFFTSRGEASRLRWVQVTHQYDLLGRLCAYLAPYNIPSTNGGWQP
jgi:hypothetical protein